MYMTEQQKFELESKIENIEIRKYYPCVVAEVIISSDFDNATNYGFRPLVTYISQNNIAMTAPVLQEKNESGSWIVSFVMPDGMSIDDLPKAKDTQINLKKIEEHYAAAIVFKGLTNFKKSKEKEQELRQVLEKHHIETIGEARVARFDPPWKPGFLRHNEVIIKIKK